MFDPRKVRSLLETVGWPRTVFLLCTGLLASRIVTFEQCIILLLVALAPLFSRYSKKK
jgi:hypothetical protein